MYNKFIVWCVTLKKNVLCMVGNYFIMQVILHKLKIKTKCFLVPKLLLLKFKF